MTTVRYGAASRPRSSGSAVCTMPPPPSTALARGFEVDPHDDPPWGWVAHLREPGILEDLPGSHVQFAPGDLLARLGDPGIGLQCPGATFARELDGAPGEGIGEAAPAEPFAHYQAGHGPHAAIGLVLCPARPRDPVDAEQALVRGARLDRTPAGRLAVEGADQNTGPPALGVTAVGLGAEAAGPLLRGKRAEGLPRLQLEPLALAQSRVGGANDGLQVLRGRLVSGDDPQ